MEIAILVFFAAIFGGVLFLLALVWFIFRRVRKSRQPNRHFSGGTNYGGHSGTHHNSIDHDDNDAAFLAGSAMFANQDSDNFNNQVYAEAARDAGTPSENSNSHDNRDFSTAPAEPNYSSYDSGSSYDSSSSSSCDSGSSYDSGSSSSDSGGSSSSSSD